MPVLAAFAATAALAWRRRDHLALHLQATAAVGVVAGVAAVSRITDQPYYYLFRWWWVLAMCTWLAIAFAALRALPEDAATRAWRVVLPAALALTVVGVALASASAADPVPTGTHEAAVEDLTPAVLDAVEPGQTYLVRPLGFSWFEVYFGLIDQLERHDVHVRVDEGFRAHAGPGRVLGPDDEPAGTLWVVTGSAVADALDDPRLEVVAEHDPLSSDERAELARLQAEQRQRLIDAGRTDVLDGVENEGVEILASVEPALDPVAAARIAELLRRGQRAAVFATAYPPPDLAAPVGSGTGAPPAGGG